MQIAMIVCSILGLGIAVMITLVSYGVFSPQHRLIPAMCRLDEGTCLKVIHSRNARVLGPPNAVLGALYYLLVIAVFLCYPTPPGILLRILQIAAGGTVILSVYLAASLIRSRTPCVLCFTSHVINILLMILFLLVPSE